MRRIKDLFSGFRPVDRLNRSPESSHSKPTPRPPVPLSPTYTSPHFGAPQPRSETNIAVCLPSSSRKRSFDTATVVSDGSQSQRTHKSTSRASNTSGVPELRHVPGYTKAPRSRKRQRYDKTYSLNGVESDPIPIEEDDEQDEVQLVPSQDIETSTKHVTPDKMAKRYRTQASLQPGSRRKLAAQIHETSPVRAKHSSLMTDRGTGSPDPLAHSTEDPKPGSKRRAMEPLEPMRGGIVPTKFTATKQPKSQDVSRSQQNAVTAEAALDVAKRIIGDGLRVRRAVSFQSRYDEAIEPEDHHLSLVLRDMSFILHARGHDNTDWTRYQWCTVNLGKLNRVEHGSDAQECRLVYMARSSDASTNSGALIMIDFITPEDYSTFVRWFENYRSKALKPFPVTTISQ